MDCRLWTSWDGGRCRHRTYDFHHVKVALDRRETVKGSGGRLSETAEPLRAVSLLQRAAASPSRLAGHLQALRGSQLGAALLVGRAGSAAVVADKVGSADGEHAVAGPFPCARRWLARSPVRAGRGLAGPAVAESGRAVLVAAARSLGKGGGRASLLPGRSRTRDEDDGAGGQQRRCHARASRRHRQPCASFPTAAGVVVPCVRLAVMRAVDASRPSRWPTGCQSPTTSMSLAASRT